MPELEDDIMVEDVSDFQQEPEPKLSETHRRKLDSIVNKMMANKESDDDIRFVVDDFKKKYATKPLVSEPKKEPTPGREMESVFGGKQPKFGAAAVGSDGKIVPVAANQPGQIAPLINRPKAIANAGKAQKKLQDELHANDDVVETMIRNQRMNVAGQNFNAATAESQATGMQQFQEPQVGVNEQPVTPDEISLFKSDTEANEQAARNLFKEVTERKPEKKKEIESSVYRLDAVRSVQGNDVRFEKIEKNAKGIEKGELVYNITGGQLLKPEGVVGSLLTGWKQKSQLFDDFSFFNNKSDDEIITELERRRTDYDPDEPIPVPKHKMGEVTQMLGSMPLKSIVAGTATTAVGLPEAAPFVAGAVGAADFYQMGYAGTLQNVYYQMRDEGKSEAEALQIARTQAQKEGAIDAVMGGAMSVAGMRIGTKPVNFSSGYRAAATSFLKSAGKEGAFQSLLGAGGELSKNLLAQQAGIKRETGANVLQAIESNFLLTVGMGAAAKLGKGISSVKYKSLLNGLSKLDNNLLEGNILSEVNAGRLTEKQAENIRNEVKAYKEVDSQIPENITEEARIDIQKKIERRTELENEMETKNKAFHPEIKEKIAKLDEEIVELSKQKEKKEKEAPEIKEAKLLIDDALEEGVMTEVYGAMATQNPEGFMKFVADQSFGRTEEGDIHGLGNTESQMRQQFGDKIVDKAKEMFPLEEKVVAEPVAETPIPKAEPKTESSDPNWTYGKRDADAPPPTPEGPEMIGITHADMDSVAKELNLPTYEGDPETVAGWDAEAQVRMQKDPDAMTKLFDKLRNDGRPDPAETRMMIRYMADLKAKYNKNPTPELLNDIKRAKDLFNVVGRMQGKEFRARQSEVPVEESLADFHMNDIEFNKAPLTEQQTAQSTKEFQEISAAKTALEEKVAKLEAELVKKKADEKIKKEQATAKKSETKDYKAERQQIIEDIKKKWNESKGQASATFVPYAEQLAKIAPDVVKLVRNLIEDGVTKLPDIVKSVHDQIRGVIPEVTEGDVQNIIAGEYTKKKTHLEVAEKLFDVRKQLKLIADLEALEAGVMPKSERNKVKRNRKIEELKKKIAETEKYPSTDIDSEKLAAIKTRSKNEITKLEQQIKTGDFSKEKKEPLKLDKEAQELRDKVLRLREERDIRLMQMEYDSIKGMEKVAREANQYLNISKQIKSTGDVSMPFRQGIVEVASKLLTIPFKMEDGKLKFTNFAAQRQLAQSFGKMYSSLAQEKYYRRIMGDIKDSPRFEMAQEAGLKLADPNSPIAEAREEFTYPSKLEKVFEIPAKIGINVNPVKASNRSATVFINVLKWNKFNEFVDMFEKQGMTMRNSPDAYKEAARYANQVVSRGHLGPKVEMANALTSRLFFSLRLQASRLQMMTKLVNPHFYTKVPKEVRIEYLKDMAKFIAMGTGIALAAKAAGLEVEIDPRSSDFGKIKVGDTRYDIWGGFVQYVTLISRIATGETKSGDLVKKLGGKQDEAFYRFLRSKASPETGTLLNFLTNERLDFEPVTAGGEALDFISPILWVDVADAYKDGGVQKAFITAVLAAHGVGATTYESKGGVGSGGEGKRAKKASKPKRAARN